jgi:hypothetical protein
VAAIANGRRGLYGRESESEEDDRRVHQGPAERCPICGFLVYMPCLVCQTREHRHWNRVWKAFGAVPRSAANSGRSRTKVVRRRCNGRPRSARVA